MAARRPRFVVQQHDATTLHWDFRLEAGGVYKSWAVPKGPSTDPREKRLAVPTPDHPLSWGRFEGVIPEGEYGAGTVIVWDAGTYRNLHDTPVASQIRKGHVAVWLEGEKLRGGFALTRVARTDGERWLLVKMKDEHADARRNPVRTERASVRSGKTIEEVARGGRERRYATARAPAIRRLRRGQALGGGTLPSRDELHDRAKLR